MSNQQSAEFWDGQAASFDDEADHGLRDPLVRDAWRVLLRSVLPAPPAAIADLGCGTGSVSVLLAEDGHCVTGVDLSPKMIVAARRKAANADVSITFRAGDAACPDLDPASVDAVVVRHVTWALPDPADALRRWVALLRDRGTLILIEGRWSTGVGIGSRELVELVRPVLAHVEVQPLTDTALWGSPIDDERYLLIARAEPRGAP